jgi:DNA-binding GntR family transcriptional regulator
MVAMSTLSHRAYQYIRQKLMVGEIKAGQRLSEVSLAREIGVSRTPVREAVSKLASEGFIERDGPFGVVVKQVSRAELVELLSLRLLLEPYAASLAARRATDEQIEQLGAAMRRLRQISRKLRDDLGSWNGELGRQLTLADMVFHLIILSTAASPRVARIIDDFHVVTTRYRPPSLRSLPNLASVLMEHWRIYRAIRGRDPKAARAAMRVHNLHGRRKTLLAFDRRQREAEGAARVTDWSALLEGLVDQPRPLPKRRAPRAAKAKHL